MPSEPMRPKPSEEECERLYAALLEEYNPGPDALAEIAHLKPCDRLRALQIVREMRALAERDKTGAPLN